MTKLGVRQWNFVVGGRMMLTVVSAEDSRSRECENLNDSFRSTPSAQRLARHNLTDHRAVLSLLQHEGNPRLRKFDAFAVPSVSRRTANRKFPA